MLLALWSGFWNPASWVQGPVPPPVVVATRSGGHGRKDFGIRASEDFWDAREAMMRRYLPVPKARVKPEAVKLVARHNVLVERIQRMPDMARLKSLEDKISGLALQIRKFEVDSEEEEILLALLL